MTNPDTYDRATIWLHWTTAGLVLVGWLIGYWLEAVVPRGALRSSIWSTHVLLGFALALVLAARIIWRSTGGRGIPGADRGALHLIAKLNHYILYGLLIAVVALGIINALVRGFDLFGLVLPRIGDPHGGSRSPIGTVSRPMP